MATDDTNCWLYNNSLYAWQTRAETAVCADTMLPTSVCIVDTMKDYRQGDIPNSCFWLTRWFHTLICSVREIKPFLTWRCRGCCHQGTPSAWCSPWLCRGWKSAWSGRRTRREPRSSWPDVRQRCGSCCCWRGRPGGRPASSASGTASWWSPGDKPPVLRNQRHRVDQGHFSATYHVHFRYAVDALNLHVNTNRKSWTYKRSNFVKTSASSMNHPSAHLPEITPV